MSKNGNDQDQDRSTSSDKDDTYDPPPITTDPELLRRINDAARIQLFSCGCEQHYGRGEGASGFFN